MCCGTWSGMRSSLLRKKVKSRCMANLRNVCIGGFVCDSVRLFQGKVINHIRKVQEFGSKKRNGAGFGHCRAHCDGSWRQGMGRKRSGARTADLSLYCHPLIFLSTPGLFTQSDNEYEDGGYNGRRGQSASGSRQNLFYVPRKNIGSALKENEKVISLAGKDVPVDEAIFYMGLIYAHPANSARDYRKSMISFRRLIRDYPGSPLLLNRRRSW